MSTPIVSRQINIIIHTVSNQYILIHIFHSIENPYKTTYEECPVDRGYIKATPSSQVFPYTTFDSITINISGNVPTTQKNLVYTSWYILPSGTSVSSLLKLPTGITQTLRINNPTHLHAGTFEVYLQLNPWNYIQQLACPDEYRYFVYYRSRVGANRIILDQISFNLQYYGELKLPACCHTNYILFYCLYSSIEPAAVLIQSSRPALWDDEYTTLNCTAHDGYPPTSSISWVKNGRVISTTSDEELVISVAANDTSPFGRYKCVVNNSVTTMETSILMKQKGDNYCSCRHCGIY